METPLKLDENSWEGRRVPLLGALSFCLPVFFSDQSGAIYEGEALGCH
jgi:hypothetical protein